MTKMNRFLTGLLFLAITTGCRSAETDTTTVVRVGDTVPDFTVNMLDGRSLSISELRGKTVLLNFFATWCGPCNLELERIQKDFWPEVRDRNDFVWLTIGREHTLEEVREFRDGKGLTLPMGADPDRGIYSRFAKIYIPRNFLIDRTGRIIWHEKGFDESGYEEMKRQIKKQLDPS